jgi:hypothetical protein
VAAHGVIGAFEALTISSHRLCRWYLTGHFNRITKKAVVYCLLFPVVAARSWLRRLTLPGGKLRALCECGGSPTKISRSSRRKLWRRGKWKVAFREMMVYVG